MLSHPGDDAFTPLPEILICETSFRNLVVPDLHRLPVGLYTMLGNQGLMGRNFPILCRRHAASYEIQTLP
jgi:hypothetical protein